MRWIPESKREECISYYGNMSQIAGLRRYRLLDGKAAGVEAVDVDTGGGLRFTVLPGRGMDIAWTAYRGIPVAYLSKAGVTGPAYHDPREMQWLKSFFAGLVTTCGISNAGPPCRDDMPVIGDTPFGLHGDISNTGADNVCTREEWLADGRYQMTVSGRMQEGRLHGEHMQLRREVTTFLGEKRLHIHDVYSNEGDTPQPLMFFYHINVGHPILSKGSRFLAPSRDVVPASEEARREMETYALCDEPKAGYLEQQFYHTMDADSEGNTLAALINDELALGVCLRYNVQQMEKFSQWKVCRKGEYVLAFEPGNCYPVGRDVLKKQNALEWLEPMAEKHVSYTIELLDGNAEISALEKAIQALRN